MNEEVNRVRMEGWKKNEKVKAHKVTVKKCRLESSESRNKIRIFVALYVVVKAVGAIKPFCE